MERMSATVAKAAAEHLSEHDAILRLVIAERGLCTIRPHTDYYQELVDAIISQQLSVYAARAIEQRFRDLFDGKFPTAEQILSKNVEDLRALGFSRAKATYVLDLAQHVADGRVRFDHLDSLSNAEVATELTAVKGVGEWTAHMFLMFCMGRTDVLPVGDLGIRSGIRKLYGLDHLATPQEIAEIAARNQWHPYESIASWYIWQSLNNAPAV